MSYLSKLASGLIFANSNADVAFGLSIASGNLKAVRGGAEGFEIEKGYIKIFSPVQLTMQDGDHYQTGKNYFLNLLRTEETSAINPDFPNLHMTCDLGFKPKDISKKGDPELWEHHFTLEIVTGPFEEQERNAYVRDVIKLHQLLDQKQFQCGPSKQGKPLQHLADELNKKTSGSDAKWIFDSSFDEVTICVGNTRGEYKAGRDIQVSRETRPGGLQTLIQKNLTRMNYSDSFPFSEIVSLSSNISKGLKEECFTESLRNALNEVCTGFLLQVRALMHSLKALDEKGLTRKTNDKASAYYTRKTSEDLLRDILFDKTVERRERRVAKLQKEFPNIPFGAKHISGPNSIKELASAAELTEYLEKQLQPTIASYKGSMGIVPRFKTLYLLVYSVLDKRSDANFLERDAFDKLEVGETHLDILAKALEAVRVVIQEMMEGESPKPKGQVLPLAKPKNKAVELVALRFVHAKVATLATAVRSRTENMENMETMGKIVIDITQKYEKETKKPLYSKTNNNNKEKLSDYLTYLRGGVPQNPKSADNFFGLLIDNDPWEMRRSQYGRLFFDQIDPVRFGGTVTGSIGMRTDKDGKLLLVQELRGGGAIERDVASLFNRFDSKPTRVQLLENGKLYAERLRKRHQVIYGRGRLEGPNNNNGNNKVH